MHKDAGLGRMDTGYALVIDVTDGAAIVSVFGELDLCVSADLEASLVERENAGRPVVADMSECRFIDASVVTALLRARGRLGDRLCIVAPEGCATHRLLQIVELVGPLRVYPSVREALGSEASAPVRTLEAAPTTVTHFVPSDVPRRRARRFLRAL